MILYIEIHQLIVNWKPSSLSELIPIIFNIELTHFGSEASIYMTLLQESVSKPFLIKNCFYYKDTV